VTTRADLPPKPLPYEARHEDLDCKIVAALERVAQSLRLLLWQEARGNQLTPLQVNILLYLVGHEGEGASAIARRLGLAKATISEALATLEGKGLVERRSSLQDGRARELHLTELGRQVAGRVASWGEAVRQALLALQPREKVNALRFLMILIASLQQAGIVQVARMCITCRFFQRRRGGYYCHLLRSPLSPRSLRLDCPDHQPVVQQ